MYINKLHASCLVIIVTQLSKYRLVLLVSRDQSQAIYKVCAIVDIFSDLFGKRGFNLSLSLLYSRDLLLNYRYTSYNVYINVLVKIEEPFHGAIAVSYLFFVYTSQKPQQVERKRTHRGENDLYMSASICGPTCYSCRTPTIYSRPSPWMHY